MHIVFMCIFSLAGYNAAVTIKEVNESDLVYLEEFARTIPALIARNSTHKLKKNLTKDIIEYILADYASNAEEFTFHRGEKTIILQIAKFVQCKVKTEDDYSFFSGVDWAGNESPTVETPVGSIFAEPEVGQRNVTRREIPRDGRLVRANVETAKEVLNVDPALVIRTLVDCCLIKLKHIIVEYCDRNEEELNFMAKCGVTSVDSLSMEIVLKESDLECLQNIRTLKPIAAYVKCYCKSQSSAYFRSKANLLSTMESSVNPNTIEELRHCWSTANFKKHIKSHNKLYVTSNAIHQPPEQQSQPVRIV